MARTESCFQGVQMDDKLKSRYFTSVAQVILEMCGKGWGPIRTSSDQSYFALKEIDAQTTIRATTGTIQNVQDGGVG